MIANHTATLKLEWFNLFDCLNFGFAQPQYYICDPPCANHTSANALMNALPHLEAIEAHPVSGLEPQSACFVHVLSQEGSLTQPGILPPGEGWESGDIFP